MPTSKQINDATAREINRDYASLSSTPNASNRQHGETAQEWQERVSNTQPGSGVNAPTVQPSHTPGPWCEDAAILGERVTRITSPAGGVVATVNAVPDGTPGKRHANAQLIACAPELLEALRVVCGPHTDAQLAQARAILAKASGVQS